MAARTRTSRRMYALKLNARILLEHGPSHLHLVLISRTEPALPLARLRLRSQVLELRADDLHFTQAETTSFLIAGW